MRTDDYYKNEADKRTKEYKEWKALKELELEQSTKGLADTVEAIAKATGITKVVKTFFGEDCGCGDRKDVFWMCNMFKEGLYKSNKQAS